MGEVERSPDRNMTLRAREVGRSVNRAIDLIDAIGSVALGATLLRWIGAAFRAATPAWLRAGLAALALIVFDATTADPSPLPAEPDPPPSDRADGKITPMSARATVEQNELSRCAPASIRNHRG